MGTKSLEIFNRVAEIVKICIVQRDHDAFPHLSPAMCGEPFNKTGQNRITKEGTIAYNNVGSIQQIVYSVDGQNDRNQRLFAVNFWFDASWNLVWRWAWIAACEYSE
jgi:hypothetical protein